MRRKRKQSRRRRLRKFDKKKRMKLMDIKKLNDDCLVLIFNYLPMADRVRIQRVSKKWQALSIKSWSSFKSLDHQTKTWGIKDNKIERRVYNNIIDLCGKYLTSIVTDAENLAKNAYKLPKIQKLHLTDINLQLLKMYKNARSLIYESQNQISESSFKEFQELFNMVKTTYQNMYNDCEENYLWLKSKGQNITSFHLEVHTTVYFNDENIGKHLREMKNLKSFYFKIFTSSVRLRGSFLLDLPFDSIEAISLFMDCTQPIEVDLLSTIIKKCKNLREFRFDNYKRCDLNVIFSALSSQAASLRKLHLQLLLLNRTTYKLLGQMSLLIHLEKLDVSCNSFVTDEYVIVVCNNCKNLTYFNISGCVNVTDDGFSSICNLEKLNILKICGMPNIQNPLLHNLRSLKELYCFSNKIIDKCLLNFLKTAYQLQILDIRICHLLTFEVLNAVVELIKMRNNEKILYLKIATTRINQNILDEVPKLLNIDDIDDITSYNSFDSETISCDILVH